MRVAGPSAFAALVVATLVAPACNRNGQKETTTPVSPGVDSMIAAAWQPLSGEGAPRNGPPLVGVWGGGQLLIWGGTGCTTQGYCGEGGRYDAAANRWQRISDAGAPAARMVHAGVWSGKALLVWGGQGCPGGGCDDGGAYDPASDRWQAIPATGAPATRGQHSAVWTGSQMIVWGGRTVPISIQSVRLGAGGAWDPERQQWTATVAQGEPSPRFSHTAIWTGKVMIVWGGDTGSVDAVSPGNGGVYDPAAQQWRPTSVQGAPRGRYQHVAVWSGSEMIVWGGVGVDGGRPVALTDGAAYNPQTDGWRRLTASGEPPAGFGRQAVWTGARMFVWGGASSAGYLYDPAADRWDVTNAAGGPRPRTNHVLVWTGSQALVWGGLAGESTAADGASLRL